MYNGQYPKEGGSLVWWKTLQWCCCSNQSIAWYNVIVNISVSLLIALNCWLQNRLQTSAKFSFLHLHSVLKADRPSGQHCLSSQKFNLQTKRRSLKKLSLPLLQVLKVVSHYCLCLQCFDAVGWATGRAYGL